MILYEGLNELNVTLKYISIPEPLAHLSGQVTDSETGQPIQDVKVSLDGQIKYTDTEGVYTFFDLAPGNYTIKFEKTNYDTLVR